MKSLQAISAGVLSVAILGISADLASAKKKDSKASNDSGTRTEAKDDSHTQASVQKEQVKKATYLGVTVRPQHEGFFAHFRDEVEHLQGVMVQDVASGSPADQAGLKAKDVLMTYDDQKLYTPGQLMSLIRDSKPGSKVKLSYQRDAETHNAMVTLAEHDIPMTRTASKPNMDKHNHSASTNDPSQWSSFDSLSIKSLGDNRFQAQVSYLDNVGKVKSLKFEGTRDEIRQDITSRSDLPKNERGHLLRALNMSSERIEFDAPRVFRTDDGRVIWEFTEPVFPFYGLEWNES